MCSSKWKNIIKGALSHFKGIKEWVEKSSGLQKVPMHSRQRREHFCLPKGWRNMLCVFVMCCCAQGSALKRKPWSIRAHFFRLIGLQAQEVSYTYWKLINKFEQQYFMLRLGKEISPRLYNYYHIQGGIWKVWRKKSFCMWQQFKTCNMKIQH